MGALEALVASSPTVAQGVETLRGESAGSLDDRPARRHPGSSAPQAVVGEEVADRGRIDTTVAGADTCGPGEGRTTSTGIVLPVDVGVLAG